MTGALTLRRGRTAAVLCILLTFCLSIIFSTAAVSAAKKGNVAKGRYYFRQSCKTCHTKGAPGGEVTPMSKTQAQWRNYFTAGKHNKSTEALAKVMTPEQLHDVATYVVEHAADSLQPETCGK